MPRLVYPAESLSYWASHSFRSDKTNTDLISAFMDDLALVGLAEKNPQFKLIRQVGEIKRPEPRARIRQIENRAFRRTHAMVEDNRALSQGFLPRAGSAVDVIVMNR